MHTANLRYWNLEEQKMTYLALGDNKENNYNIKNFEDMFKQNTVFMYSAEIKDINNTIVYEGDILKWNSMFRGKKFEEYSEVVWKDDIGELLVNNDLMWKFSIGEFEIIGNIYESPQLREKLE